GAKSRMLNVRMARRSRVAKASCSSSAAVSRPASSVVRTSKPRLRRSRASRAMMWRAKKKPAEKAPGDATHNPGLLFLSVQRVDLVTVIEVIAQPVEDLGLGEPKGLGDHQDGLPAQVEGGDVTHRDAETIDHRLAAADALPKDDVRVFGFDDLGH